MAQSKNLKIWSDKLTVSLNILNKEGEAIGYMSDVAKKLQLGYCDQATVYRVSSFIECWRCLSEIYQFMKDDKIKIFEEKFEERAKEVGRLRDCIRRYNEGIRNLKYGELLDTMSLMGEIMTYSGYRDNESMFDMGIPEDQSGDW